MKVDRHGKAKILSQEEIQRLFREGFQNNHDHVLWGEISSGAENCVKQNFALNGSQAALVDTLKLLILP